MLASLNFFRCSVVVVVVVVVVVIIVIVFISVVFVESLAMLDMIVNQFPTSHSR